MRSFQEYLSLTQATCQILRASTAAAVLSLVIGATPRAQADDDLLSILGGESQATNPAQTKATAGFLRSMIGQTSAEQNIFIQFFEQGAMDKALYQWSPAFEGHSFAKTENGRALYAYLLLKNGVRVSALEILFAIEKPESISPELMKIWKSAVSETDDVWTFANIAKAWQPFWTEAFGVAAEIRVRSKEVYGPEQMDTLKELVKKTQLDTVDRALIEWQLVLAMADGSEAGGAAKVLAHLMKAPNNPVGQDLMTITAARLLYQNGFLDAAIKYYEKVPKSSDYWFDAQEEVGWAHIRKGEPQNAIAITQTLITPAFAAQVGPEPMFLRSLAQLKICDYPQVVASLNLFRERFRDRSKALLALTENAEQPSVKKLVERMKKEPVKLTDLGSDAKLLPRYVTRDASLAQLVRTEAALEKEGRQAGELYARSLSGGTAKVGFEASLEAFRKSMESRVQTARNATYDRVKRLAEEEINEISQILSKLHIVEAEVLQQISVADRVIGATSGRPSAEKKGTTGSQSRDRIWFPAEQKEQWFDELANYRVDVKKGCESVKR